MSFARKLRRRHKVKPDFTGLDFLSNESMSKFGNRVMESVGKNRALLARDITSKRVAIQADELTDFMRRDGNLEAMFEALTGENLKERELRRHIARRLAMIAEEIGPRGHFPYDAIIPSNEVAAKLADEMQHWRSFGRLKLVDRNLAMHRLSEILWSDDATRDLYVNVDVDADGRPDFRFFDSGDRLPRYLLGVVS